MTVSMTSVKKLLHTHAVSLVSTLFTFLISLWTHELEITTKVVDNNVVGVRERKRERERERRTKEKIYAWS